MNEAAIPSPLPFAVTILPLLLSTSNEALPPATLSSSVLQRHYYLSATPDSPSTYLQASSDSSVQDAVEARREALASTFEDVKLSSTSEIQCSRTVHEEQKLVARIKLSKAQTPQEASHDDTSLVLLVVYEEVEAQSEGGNAAQAEASSSTTTRKQRDEESEEESGWRYYDLQLPHSRSNLNSSSWHSSIADANAALARLIPSTSTDARAHRSTSISTTSGKQKETKAQKALREKKREEDNARGLQVEEGPDQDPDDYWAGCESSDDEAGQSDIAADNAAEDDNEDDYWNNYGSTSPGKDGSIIDSGHHESEGPPEDEDYTMRYDQDNSDAIGHFEYAQTHHADDHLPSNQRSYSFEPDHSLASGVDPRSRVLVDSLAAHSDRPADTFLTTLHSSLQRVSSSQEDSASSHADENEHQANGYMNGNGHAGPAIQRNDSPTIDSAIAKSISGLWETYLLSSALGGGGKSREIAAYEFMELVQAVVNGDMD
ncbi:hypothetical protein P389DRAFT_168216 [Cystobasidium minutum MCA 4210]|uniref:uncharacterized protein n=1 Tax=Cystobasidium minutum MCA 4210 TaxID=1397322 RepID=UPI0034CF3884|eukprot:jgi/Rhomi1/168216/fgenesh1_kg.2_\